jgi:hypothetical protein
MHLTDTGAVKVGAAYKSGVTPPDWLTVGASGSGTEYSFAFNVNTTALAAGTYTTTVTIGTANASDTILHTQDVQVSYNLRDGLLVVPNSQPVSGISGSSETQQQTRAFTVAAPSGTQWTATSSASWLSPPQGPQTNGGTFNAAIDTSGLAAGTHTGTITLRNNADSTDTSSLNITLQLTAPAFQGYLEPLVIGGNSGLEFGLHTHTIALNTGQNAYPLTVTTSTTSGGNWLNAEPGATTISSVDNPVLISANRLALATGTYTGQVTLQATVNGQQITRTIPVAFNFEQNHISVGANGVAFAAFPSKQVLYRSQLVLSAWPDPRTSWDATSDQSWLTVTPSGMTGTPIELTANPSSLAAGQYFATVTISSPDVRVANEETIRVGLTVSATDPTPVPVTYPSITTNLIAVNPVDPVVYAVASSGTSINLFNAHTGAAMTAISGTFTQAMALAVSSDGTTLFIVDRTATADRVVALNSATAAVRTVYPLASQPTDPAIEYIRVDGHSLLLSLGTSESIDLATGDIKAIAVSGPAVAVSPLWRLLLEQNTGFSPSTVTSRRIRYTTLSNAGLLLYPGSENWGIEANHVRSNGQDIALSHHNDLLYVAAGAPYQFDALGPNTLSLQKSFDGSPYPNNVESCWRGQFAGGAYSSLSAQGDIWVYGPDDQLRGQLESGTSRQLFARALKFSGDCTRIVSGSGAGLRIQNVP